jgi:hypothetical protein
MVSGDISEENGGDKMRWRATNRLCRATLVAAVILLAAGTASAQQVTYNYMPGTDFSKYHTYKWVTIPSNLPPNQIVDAEIKQAINNQLAIKGFKMVTGEAKADLYVGYQCALDQERQWNAWGMGGGLRWGGMGTAQSSTITNGMLADDFYDPNSQQPSGEARRRRPSIPAAISKRIWRSSTRP